MPSLLERLLKWISRKPVVVGLIGLVWFLYRSGTKPSRAAYPCQRAAASASYTFLVLPTLSFLSGVVDRLKLMFRHSDSRKRALVIALLLSASLSFLASGLAILASMPTDTTEYIRQRTSLQERLTTVSVVRVEGGKLEDALAEALGYLGGIESLVPEGSKVLVKPNIVRNQPPPDTTDPLIVEALVEMINRRNPRVVWIADGSGEGNTLENFQALGYLQVAERTGAVLVDLNVGEMTAVSVPGGGEVFDSFIFNRVVVDADVFISVAAMKTHSQAVVTLGMKNLIGIAPGSVYGFPKSILHDEASKKGDDYMAGVIVNLCNARKIDLVVIDGRVGMEGQGPHDGTPVKLDLIIAGRDPVATDSVASLIMGFDPDRVPTLDLGSKRGMGTNNLHNIEIRGEDIESAFHPFKSAAGHERFQVPLTSYHLSKSKDVLTALSVALWSLTTSFIFLLRKTHRVKSNLAKG